MVAGNWGGRRRRNHRKNVRGMAHAFRSGSLRSARVDRMRVGYLRTVMSGENRGNPPALSSSLHYSIPPNNAVMERFCQGLFKQVIQAPVHSRIKIKVMRDFPREGRRWSPNYRVYSSFVLFIIRRDPLQTEKI